MATSTHAEATLTVTNQRRINSKGAEKRIVGEEICQELRRSSSTFSDPLLDWVSARWLHSQARLDPGDKREGHQDRARILVNLCSILGTKKPLQLGRSNAPPSKFDKTTMNGAGLYTIHI